MTDKEEAYERHRKMHRSHRRRPFADSDYKDKDRDQGWHVIRTRDPLVFRYNNYPAIAKLERKEDPRWWQGTIKMLDEDGSEGRMLYGINNPFYLLAADKLEYLMKGWSTAMVFQKHQDD